MFGTDYGPFASIIVYAGILAAVFSTILLKAVGKVKKWTFLAGKTSIPFMVTVGARGVAVVLIVLTYMFLDKSNYYFFGFAALIPAALLIYFIRSFDIARQSHLCEILEINADGTEKKGWFGGKKSRWVVIGRRDNMTNEAAVAYKKFGSGSLCKFLSGYGSHQVNDASEIWTMQTLAAISSRMTTLLTLIMLCGVMALYLSASAIEMHQRPVAAPTQTQHP